MAKKADRAAQFLPFDALKGLQEELRAREEKRTRVAKVELSEEQTEELSKILSQVSNGNGIKVTFYKNGHYYDAVGKVTKIDKVYRYLILGEEKIFFDNLYSVSLLTT